MASTSSARRRYKITISIRDVMLSLSKHFLIKIKTHLDLLRIFRNSKNLSKSKIGGERTGLQFEITVKSKVEKS